MLLSDTLRSTLADAIDDAINVGSPGEAKFQNGAQTATYATCVFEAAAFGAAATGVITLAATPTDTSASAGTTTKIGFYDGSAALVFTLGVNDTGSPEVTISNNTFQAGDQVEISSLTVTVPAGSAITT
jgi:hypothetical protein